MAHGSPPLSRRQLQNILGLASGASATEWMEASLHLLSRLESRRPAAEGAERQALEQEIEALTASLLFGSGQPGSPDQDPGGGVEPPPPPSMPFARERLLLALVAILSVLVVGLVAVRFTGEGSRAASRDARVKAKPARLIIESRPTDAQLRIRKPDSEELLLKIPAGGARVELDAGRYALVVSRDDCPDVWDREIELEEAETRRYEPTICKGTGELVVRSNVHGDRLRIDDLDQGETRPAPHLLGVGNHRIRVDKRGFIPFDGTVRIVPNGRIELHADLVRASGPRDNNGTAGPGVALPFKIVQPSQPPVDPSGSPIGRSSTTEAFLPEPLLPDSIRPAGVEIPKPALDLDFQRNPRVPFAGLPNGGSTTWHDAISSRVISRFDRDGSGLIDRADETEEIPCRVWKDIERSFDQGRLGLSMSRLYGFDGSEWHPKALGFAREQRGLAYERMRGCGLAP